MLRGARLALAPVRVASIPVVRPGFTRATRGLASHPKVWKVYLSGEIHSTWRKDIEAEVMAAGLSDKISLSGPNPSHEDSDDCGAIILGMEEKRQNWDRIGATMNAVRTRTLIEEADVVVVRFGEKYRQVKCGAAASARRTPHAKPNAARGRRRGRALFFAGTRFT
jgi:YtoQ family protein